jgi:hypothetical protein
VRLAANCDGTVGLGVADAELNILGVANGPGAEHSGEEGLVASLGKKGAGLAGGALCDGPLADECGPDLGGVGVADGLTAGGEGDVVPEAEVRVGEDGVGNVGGHLEKRGLVSRPLGLVLAIPAELLLAAGLFAAVSFVRAARASY